MCTCPGIKDRTGFTAIDIQADCPGGRIAHPALDRGDMEQMANRFMEEVGHAAQERQE